MSNIRIKTVSYHERPGRPLEWSIDGLVLGQINLLVGKNATGKTLALNVIGNLAHQFIKEGRRQAHEAGYKVCFDNDGQSLDYSLRVENGEVTEETVSLNGKVKLRRNATEMTIFAKDLNKDIKFQPPKDEVAAVSRRDDLQHPFLNPLHEWASGVRHYHFGATLGKMALAVLIDGGPPANERDENQVVGIFRKGKKELGQAYVATLLSDMRKLGYDVTDVDLETPEHITPIQPSLLPGPIQAIAIREHGIDGQVFQDAMGTVPAWLRFMLRFAGFHGICGRGPGLDGYCVA